MRYLLCRLLGHRWGWTTEAPWLVCIRCPAVWITGKDARRPILRPTYPAWWRSGEKVRVRHRIQARLRRKRADYERRLTIFGTIGGFGAAAGANAGGVAYGTVLGEDHQHRLNMQQMQAQQTGSRSVYLAQQPGAEYRVSVEPGTEVQVPGGCRVSWVPDD